MMHLVPIFTPETNKKCFPKFIQMHNASSSIKTAIACLPPTNSTKKKRMDWSKGMTNTSMPFTIENTPIVWNSFDNLDNNYHHACHMTLEGHVWMFNHISQFYILFLTRDCKIFLTIYLIGELTGCECHRLKDGRLKKKLSTYFVEMMFNEAKLNCRKGNERSS